jgi:nucleotide-binding universal stress UspA family protein
MIKDAIVNLSLDSANDPAAAYAVSLAEAFGAHLAGVAFLYDPVIAAEAGMMAARIIEEQSALNEQAANAATARFNELARRAGISAETMLVRGSFEGAYRRFGELARRFDLSVVGQGRPEEGAAKAMIVEGALFESGRPVIVVPYIEHSGLRLDRVMACWDGSRTAARAIADAMPLLARAKAIDVVTIATEAAKSDEMPAADMAQHLARHGLNVTIERVSRGDVEIASSILNYTADRSVDFVVMGGYGHSRLREFVLGGATRGILAAMTVPVLMSH